MPQLRTLMILLLLIISLTLWIVPGCFGNEDEPPAGEQEDKEIPEEIEIIKEDLLSIMLLADIATQLEAQEPLHSQEPSEDAPSSNGEEDESKENNSNDNEENEANEEKLAPEWTFEDTILREIVEIELADNNQADEANNNAGLQMPDDPKEGWNDIKKTVSDLHDHWNQLEPQLVDNDTPEAHTNSFEEALNDLTVFSSQENSFQVLASANRMTLYLSKFKGSFLDNSLPAAFELKYNVRSILLNTKKADYAGANSNLDSMAALHDPIEVELNREEEGGVFEQYHYAFEDLEDVVNQQEFDLVKVKSVPLMQNIMEIIGVLEE